MAARQNFLLSKGFRKWAYKISGMNQYGLLRDDCVSSTANPDVEEALRRLPADLKNARNFRIIRALQLDCQKKILPKEQWTKFEEDVLYLQPYIEEVIAERKEREKWDAE